MKDFLIDELEIYDVGLLAYSCKKCDGLYILEEGNIPSNAREAYKTTVAALNNLLDGRDDEVIRLMQKIKKMKVYEIMANSFMYSNIKAFKEVKEYITKKKYKIASSECSNMIKFLKRNSEKAKNNELVKEFVSGKIKNT